jgi:hypothetical protein
MGLLIEYLNIYSQFHHFMHFHVQNIRVTLVRACSSMTCLNEHLNQETPY